MCTLGTPCLFSDPHITHNLLQEDFGITNKINLACAPYKTSEYVLKC